MSKLYLNAVPIDPIALTAILCDSLSEDQLKKLIIDIDESVCSLEFTTELRDRFVEIVKKEHEAK